MSRQFSSWIVDFAFSQRDDYLAVATAEEFVHILNPASLDTHLSVQTHRNAGILSLANVGGGEFWVGGDDGRIVAISEWGFQREVVGPGKGWVTWIAPTAAGVAIVRGNRLMLHPKDAECSVFEHDCTGVPNAIAASRDGWLIAVADRRGLEIVDVQMRTSQQIPDTVGQLFRTLEFSPCGEYLIAGMQENQLQIWRLRDMKGFGMYGYSTRIRSLSFTAESHWLATSGADCIVLWPFDDAGPEGRHPKELRAGHGICTSLACNPANDVIAAVFNDCHISLVDSVTSKCLGETVVMESRMSAMRWNHSGTALAYGTEDGAIGVAQCGVPQGN